MEEKPVSLHGKLEPLIEKFKRLKTEFSFRSFIMIVFGIALFVSNFVLFILSIMKAAQTRDFIEIFMYMLFGIIGIMVSAVLIFFVTIELSLPPEKENKVIYSKKKLSKIGQEIQAKEKKKKLAFIIVVTFIMFAVGIGTSSIYFGNQIKYANYPSVEAKVVGYEGTGDGSRTVYEYYVNGVKYRHTGHVESSGAAVPFIGDKEILKYNPNNPKEIYLRNESMFFLLFGSIFNFFGLICVLNALHEKGIVNGKAMLSFILLGLSAVCFLAAYTTKSYSGLINFFADNLWLFFVMMFSNVGLLEFFSMFVWLGHKKKKQNNEA